MSHMRIVIAEDAVILRDGLAQLLSAYGHDVVAAVGDGDALRAAVAEHRPDIAIADIRRPPTFTDEGLRAAISLRQGGSASWSSPSTSRRDTRRVLAVLRCLDA
jgi:DNA-binding NarL/FixJ family response regulator